MNPETPIRKNFRRPSMRMVQRPRMRTTLRLRQLSVIISLTAVLLTGGFIVYFNIGHVSTASGINAGDYRSAASGNWNSINTWQKYNGTSWIAASVTPASADGAINIQSGHIVTVTAGVTGDQVTVNTGGLLFLNNGTFSLVNGTGDDLTVSGTLIINSTLSLENSSACKINGLTILVTGGNTNFQTGSTLAINNGGRYRKNGGSQTNSAGHWTVNSGGVYQQNDNGTGLPNAAWNSGSTCEITGTINTKPSNLNQLFYNFTWNCVNQTSKENIAGSNLNTINGDFKIISTGTGSIQLNQSSDNTYNIGGNFYHQGGTLFATETGGSDIYIAGNFVQSGGNFNMSDGTTSNGSGEISLNLDGNFSITSGTFNMSQYNGTNVNQGVGTLNLKGDFTFSGGLITETAASSGHGQINFNKPGTQNVIGGGTISNIINFTVINGAKLRLGTSILAGKGTFTLSGGSGLMIGSATGITSSGPSGNIQVTGLRSYSTGADYTYNGTVAQNSGNGLPATVHNLTINNSYNLTLPNNVSVSDTLILESGKIITGNNKEIKISNISETSIRGYSSDRYIVGNLRRGISGSGSYDFPVGTSSYYELINITLSGTSGFSDILGSFTQSNPSPIPLPPGLLANGKKITGMLDYGYWSLTPNSDITGGTYSVTCVEQGHINLGANAADYCVLKKHHGPDPWSSEGIHNDNTQHINNGKVTAVRSGLTSFSNFGIGFGGGALPVKLLSFIATLNEEHVDLNWTTASEINNDYFTIEKSHDGKNFETVSKIDGSGNTTTQKDYASVDPNPYKGYSYYRLKQTDYDGHFSYSNIAPVKNKAEVDSSLVNIEIKSITPNPFNERFKVNFMVRSAVAVEFILMKSSGQVVNREKIQAQDGFNMYEFIDQHDLPGGIYFVILSHNNQKLTQKVIKK